MSQYWSSMAAFLTRLELKLQWDMIEETPLALSQLNCLEEPFALEGDNAEEFVPAHIDLRLP